MSSSQIPGTNVPPISFPGIVSGIDYNSIIQKLTQLTLAPTTQINQQIATLNAANLELIKINNLLSSVQSALGALSSPNIYDAVSATSTNLGAIVATGIAGGNAVPGVYTIDSVQTATPTSIVSNTAAGHNITDLLPSTAGIYANMASNTVPLADSYAAITPSNGSGSTGSVTIDGISVSYDVNTQSLNTILANIQTAVQAYDPSFTATLNASGAVVMSGSKPITLGSANDQGNLLDVLRLSGAQINNSGTTTSVTGTAGVGGINQATSFDSTATNAGFVTPVTSGTFTINGVSISVSASGDNLASVLAKINASNAGVVATYNAQTGAISLTNKSSGAQSIVVGSSGDTSNFLTAVGLTAAAGATTTVGQQSQVVVANPSGGSTTYYSNSNTVTTAIPGVSLQLTGNTTSQFTVTVAQDNSQLVNALNTFVSAYNSAVTEINMATQAPVVLQAAQGTSLPGQIAPAVGGGILFGVDSVTNLKNQLTNIVSGFLGNGSFGGYNSLSQIGLQMSSSFSQLSYNSQATQPGSTGQQAVNTTTFQGTDGTLQPLDATKLDAALAANPNAVQDLLNGAQGLTNQLGSYLTYATGLPTLLNNGIVGTVPSVSLLQTFQNQNTNQITQLQSQVAQIQDNANQQANTLRQEFVQTEATLAQYQSLQSQLAGFFNGSSSGS